MVIEHNITQTCGGREDRYSNTLTTFANNMFSDVTAGNVTWSDVTGTPRIWFTAGSGTSGTGASDPAAASDYRMANAYSYFEDTAVGSPSPEAVAQIDAYEEDSTQSTLILTYTLSHTVASTLVSGVISEIGIYMATAYSAWSGSQATIPPNAYSLTVDQDLKAPRRPFLVARAVVPAENRITKADDNSIHWRWSITFTG